MLQINTEQSEAITFRDGTLLLLAGPGSGKTFVLTRRISALIDSGVSPDKILVITFTKAAALEMHTRFRVLKPEANYVSFGTFHAIFFSILKSHRNYSNVAPITDFEKINMLKRAFEIAGLSSLCENFDDMYTTVGLISSFKNNGNDLDSFSQDKYEKDEFKAICNAYQELLLGFNRVDFDDMINLCLNLLLNDAAFLSKWQSKYEYILIDEFQDISTNQYELVKLLALPQNNIFAVGDDDQSIYGFRGAKFDIMQRLSTDIAGTKIKYLSRNYRSSGNIVKASQKVIKENKQRFDKLISFERDEGQEIEIYGCDNQEEQFNKLLEIIKESSKQDKKNLLAILTRTNKQGDKYATFLRSNGIKCVHKGTKKLFEEEFIKDILAYMEFAEGNRSRNVFLRICNKPLRYIKRDAIPACQVNESELKAYYSKDQNMCRRISEFFYHINRIHMMKPYLAIKYIRNVIGYDNYIKTNNSKDSLTQYEEIMDTFMHIAKTSDDFQVFKSKIKDIQDADAATESEEGIYIYTYHGSKGLEFDQVFLPDVNEGIVPSKSARFDTEIAEERRMFYVAMTRAKDRLVILYRKDGSFVPSEFIKKLIK